MKGQEEQHSYQEHDYEFCGRTPPPTVKTPGPRLVLLFKAGAKPGSGFKANFKFETEYLIPVGKSSLLLAHILSQILTFSLGILVHTIYIPYSAT